MNTEFHVLPSDDSRTHLHSRDCWCEPKITQPVKPQPDHPVVIHRANDGRELLERDWHCLEVVR